MLLYVAHNFQNVESAKKTMHKLQTADFDNVYVSPALLFDHIVGLVPVDVYADLCVDVMIMCDKCLVFENSGVSSYEQDYISRVSMEVEKIGNPE